MEKTSTQKSLTKLEGIEVLLSDKNLEVGYDTKNNLLHCNWIGFQNKELIMSSGEKILELLKKKGCSKVLNDNTYVFGPWHEAAQWTATNWFPRMERAGLKHFAWIFSPNIFAELSAKKAMPNNNIVQSFKSIEEATTWLNSL